MQEEANPIDNLIHKLKYLKRLVIKWECEQKKKANEDLVKIEGLIHEIFNLFGIFYVEEKYKLFDLEFQKSKLLK